MTTNEKYETNEEYRIIERYTVGANGVAMGKRDADGPCQFVTWEYRAASPSDYYWGHYWETKDAALDDYRTRIEEMVVAHFERTGEKPLHPPMCMTIEPSNGALINIRRGESGYYGSDWSRSNDRTYNRETADQMNLRMGVTKAQEQAMLCGSMFGWSNKLADPRSYDEQGRIPSPLKKKKDEVNHER